MKTEFKKGDTYRFGKSERYLVDCPGNKEIRFASISDGKIVILQRSDAEKYMKKIE